jgi:hypothetical protein
VPATATAFLFTLASGAVLWLLSEVARRHGLVFSRETETIKLMADRLKSLEEEKRVLEALVQALRVEIINDMIAHIGSVEITERQRRLLTVPVQDLGHIIEEQQEKL